MSTTAPLMSAPSSVDKPRWLRDTVSSLFRRPATKPDALETSPNAEIQALQDRQDEIRAQIRALQVEKAEVAKLADRPDIAETGAAGRLTQRLEALDKEIGDRHADVAVLEAEIERTRTTRKWEIAVEATQKAYNNAAQAKAAWQQSIVVAAQAFRAMKVADVAHWEAHEQLKHTADTCNQDMPGFTQGVSIRRIWDSFLMSFNIEAHGLEKQGKISGLDRI